MHYLTLNGGSPARPCERMEYALSLLPHGREVAPDTAEPPRPLLGLYMRYLNLENDWQYSLFRDEAIQTVWFWKAVSSQAVTAGESLAQLKEVVKKSV